MLLRVGRWIVLRTLSFALSLFFRETGAFGDDKIPNGPVIFVCGPHANQFVDPLMVMKHCGRPVGFLAAAVSMRRRFVGTLAALLNSIPVERPQDMAIKGVGTIEGSGTHVHGIGTRFSTDVGADRDMSILVAGETYVIAEVTSDTELVLRAPGLAAPITEPTKYKLMPKIDQSGVYDKVYDILRAGGAVGIFPEGGSHDRTTLLPLKAGFTVMALGAMAKYPDMALKIVPVGLNYFRPHRFRSTAYVEFGDALDVTPELVEAYKRGGADRRGACSKLLEQVDAALRSVTVQAPDYQTLQLARLARRLYKPDDVRLTVDQKLQLTRHFTEGLKAVKERPEVVAIQAELAAYNRTLREFDLRDHQIPKLRMNRLVALFMLLERSLLLVVLTLSALPGLVVTFPIAVIAKRIAQRKAVEAVKASSVKIAGRDVLATWKLMVALVLIPLVWLAWVVLVTLIFAVFPAKIGLNYPSPYVAYRIWIPLVFATILFPVMYLTVRFVETGLSILRSLKPLVLSLFGRDSAKELQQERERLIAELTKLVEKLGPEVMKDFDKVRVIPPRDVDFESPEGQLAAV